jgi:ATP-dependent protease ClpP protease subunit
MDGSPEMEKLRSIFFNSDKGLDHIKGYLQGTRRIPVFGPINEGFIQQIILMLAQLDYESKKRITILLSSGGGSVSHGYQLHDAIQALNSPVDVIAIGDNASLGVDILQMGERRYLLPGSRLQVHYVRHGKEWIGDDPEKLEKDMEIFKEDMLNLREQRFALYGKRTGLNRKRLQELFRYGEVHKEYFGARQAVKFKLADKILTDFKFFPERVYSKK